MTRPFHLVAVTHILVKMCVDLKIDEVQDVSIVFRVDRKVQVKK